MWCGVKRPSTSHSIAKKTDIATNFHIPSLIHFALSEQRNIRGPDRSDVNDVIAPSSSADFGKKEVCGNRQEYSLKNRTKPFPVSGAD